MPRIAGPRALPLLAAVAVAVVAMVVSAPAWAEAGRCVAAETAFEVFLPDGSGHPAGRIEICLTQHYSPVAGLHTTRLADGATGMLLSRRSISEGVVEHGQPYIQFVRASSGELVLDAYAVPDGQQRMWLYRVQRIGKAKPRPVNPALTLALGDDERADESQVVLIAAAAY